MNRYFFRVLLCILALISTSAFADQANSLDRQLNAIKDELSQLKNMSAAKLTEGGASILAFDKIISLSSDDPAVVSVLRLSNDRALVIGDAVGVTRVTVMDSKGKHIVQFKVLPNWRLASSASPHVTEVAVIRNGEQLPQCSLSTGERWTIPFKHITYATSLNSEVASVTVEGDRLVITGAMGGTTWVRVNDGKATATIPVVVDSSMWQLVN